MPCAALPPADADRLQHAAIEQTQLQKLMDILGKLDEIDLPTVQKQGLGELSTTLGTQLEVDEGQCSAADTSTTFFAPCDWPFDVLDDETWDAVYFWSDIEPVFQDPHTLLERDELLELAHSRGNWFSASLRQMRRLVPHLWYSCSYV